MPIRLSASLACANPLCFRNSVQQLDSAGLDTYHFDICDGHFAPTFLLWPGLIQHLRSLTTGRFDVHLYCTHPSRYLDELAEAGADTVVVHVEAAEPYPDLISHIKQRGLRVGLAILPGSAIPADFETHLAELSLLIVNTVGPAYAGQPFDPRGLENLRQISQIVERSPHQLEIAVDGSVSVARLPNLLAAGATHLVCGTSSIFRPEGELAQAFTAFREQVEDHHRMHLRNRANESQF